MQMSGDEEEGEEQAQGEERGRDGGGETGGAVHQNKIGKCGPSTSAFLRLSPSSATFL